MWQKSRVWFSSVKDFGEKKGKEMSEFPRGNLYIIWSLPNVLSVLGKIGKWKKLSSDGCANWWGDCLKTYGSNWDHILWDAGGGEFGDYTQFILRCFKGIVEMCNEMFRERTKDSERERSTWIREGQVLRKRAKERQKWPAKHIWVSTLGWLSALLDLHIKSYFSLQRQPLQPAQKTNHWLLLRLRIGRHIFERK